MGRKRKPGARTPKGRLSRARATAWDYGNDRVMDLIHRFEPFQGGKASQWITTPIGRAWAVGLLDGNDVDPAAIRDAGLDYAERYWGYYPSPSSVANYEGEDRRGGGWVGEDPRGHWFKLLDAKLLDAGRSRYNAAQEITVDCHWFPLDNPAWLDRLINERLLRARRPVAGGLPIAGDIDRMRLAISGLLSIVSGGTNRRATRFAA